MKADRQAAKEWAHSMLKRYSEKSGDGLVAAAYLEQSAELARLREAAKGVLNAEGDVQTGRTMKALRELLKES